MINPWDSDRVLSIEQASALARNAFDQVNPDGLQFLGSGWEFDAYLSRDNWVIRFPRRIESAELFDQERRVLQLVAKVLPHSIALPRVELLARPTLEFPYPFAAHRYIAGIAADEVEPGFLHVTASDIGQVLGAIHSIPEADARAAGVDQPPEDSEGERRWIEMGLAALGDLRRDALVNRSCAWVRSVSSSIPRYSGPLRVIHQDLSPEHVLVDSKTGHVTGVLDWTDVILGDAARDFVFLLAWRGWSFVEEVLRSYPLPIDDGFRDRLRFMSRLLTPVWLGLAQVRGTEVEKMKAWVQNAFAPELHSIQVRTRGID